MKLSATILPNDHRDFLRALNGPGSSKLYAGTSVAFDVVMACFMVAIIASLVVIFGADIVREEAADLFSDIRIVLIVTLGIILVPFGFWRLRASHRMRRKMREQAKQEFLDDYALRDGMNIGETRFEFGEDGVKISLDLVEENYAWDAFQAVRETEKSLLLMIDSGTALIVPKRAAQGDVSLPALKSFIASHIGAKA